MKAKKKIVPMTDRQHEIILDKLCDAISKDHRSENEIAQDAGVSPNTINKWTRGLTTRPRIDTVFKVCRVVGMALDVVPVRANLRVVK